MEEMKHQEREAALSREVQNGRRIMELVCRQREEEIGKIIADGYRQGVRRVNRRHILASVVVTLCLVVATVGVVGWLRPYRMSDGDRTARLAVYECTRQMIAQA